MNRTLGQDDGGAEWFWSIIEDANGDAAVLRARLQGMKREDIILFSNIFDYLRVELADDPLLENLPEGISEDTLADVAAWVVSQGRSRYEQVFHTPQSIGPVQVDHLSGSLAFVAPTLYADIYDDVIPRIEVEDVL